MTRNDDWVRMVTMPGSWYGSEAAMIASEAGRHIQSAAIMVALSGPAEEPVDAYSTVLSDKRMAERSAQKG